MSLVHCRGCGQQIHETAPICPHCGAPQTGSNAGSSAAIPAGVAGWSWGAFLFNWVWGICNGTWIALLTLVPFVGFIMAIVLGIKGREWAWKNKKWDSVEHFNRVQRKWSAWALGLTLGSVVIGVITAIAVPAYQQYMVRAQEAAAEKQMHSEQTAAAKKYEAPQAEVIAPASSATEEASPATNLAPVASHSEQLPLAAAAPMASVDIVSASSEVACSSGIECVKVMLNAASPRNPKLLQAASLRLTTFSTAALGDKKAARDLNSQGLSKYSANDYENAVELFLRAQEANPLDVEVKANLGLAYVKIGKSKEAVDALVSALELEPRRSSAWAPLAEALIQVQMPDAAYAALLLTYEFSGNKQKTLDYFRSRSTVESESDSFRMAYSRALQATENGY